MTNELPSSDSLVVCRKDDEWHPIFPAQSATHNSISSLCFEKEAWLRSKHCIESAAQARFYLKGDVVVRYEVDGIHIVPSTGDGYKLKVCCSVFEDEF